MCAPAQSMGACMRACMRVCLHVRVEVCAWDEWAPFECTRVRGGRAPAPACERAAPVPALPSGAASPTVDPSTVTLSGVMGARLASELRTNLSFQGPRRGDSTRGVMTRLSSGVRPQRRTSVSGIFHGAGGGGDGRRPSPSLRSDGHAGGSDFDNSPVVTLTGAGAQRLAMELRDQMLEKESRRSLSE